MPLSVRVLPITSRLPLPPSIRVDELKFARSSLTCFPKSHLKSVRLLSESTPIRRLRPGDQKLSRLALVFPSDAKSTSPERGSENDPVILSVARHIFANRVSVLRCDSRSSFPPETEPYSPAGVNYSRKDSLSVVV